MRIVLRNFKCWEEKVFEAPDGCVTLIKGPSGAGKSSIIQAIVWCLFKKLRNVSPHHSRGVKTSVEISFNQGSFYRQKNPGLFRAVIDGKEHQGQAAECLVASLFGDYDVWLASCYIGQGNRNNFLSSRNDEKMVLLNKLAFNAQDPAFFISRIETEMASSSSSFNVLSALLNQKLADFQDFLAGRQIDISYSRSPDLMVKLAEDIVKVGEVITSLEERERQRKYMSSALTLLLDQARLADEHLQNLVLPLISPDIYSLLLNTGISPDLAPEEIQKFLLTISPSLKERERLLRDAERLGTLILSYAGVPDSEYSQEDLASALAQERIYLENSSKASRLGLRLDPVLLTAQVAERQHLLDLQPILRKFEEEASKADKAGVPYDSAEIENRLAEYQAILDIQPAVRRYAEESAKARSVGLEYEQSAIASNITELQALLDTQPALQHYEEQVEKARKAFVAYDSDAIKQRILALQDNIDKQPELKRREIEAKKCQMVNVAYDEETITSTIKRYQELLESQPMIRVMEEIRRIEEQIRRLDLPATEITFPPEVPSSPPAPDNRDIEEMVGELDRKLVEARSRTQAAKRDNEKAVNTKNLMSCPHCNKAVRLYNGTLVGSEDNPHTSEQLHELEARVLSCEEEENALMAEKSSWRMKERQRNEEWMKLQSDISREALRISELRQQAALEQQRRILQSQEKERLEERLHALHMELPENVRDGQKSGFGLLNETNLRQVNELLAFLRSISVLPPVEGKLLSEEELRRDNETLSLLRNIIILPRPEGNLLSEQEKNATVRTLGILRSIVFHPPVTSPNSRLLSERETMELMATLTLLRSIMIIDRPNGMLLSDPERTKLSAELEIIRSIVVVEPPLIPSKMIEQIIAKKKLQGELKSLQESLELLSLPVIYKGSAADCTTLISMLGPLIEERQRVGAQRNLQEAQLGRLREEIERREKELPPVVEADLDKARQRKLELETEEKAAIEANDALEKRKDLELRREMTIKAQERLSLLGAMKQQAIDVECQTLSAVTESINASIADITAATFERPINIALQLYKTAKSTHRVKPEVNFTIAYQGGTFDSIGQMSGGEGDRVSLALTLALNKLSGCPILLLDESLSSLDADHVEIVLEALRQHCQGKTILCVSHNHVEGNYDSTIEIPLHPQILDPEDE